MAKHIFIEFLTFHCHQDTANYWQFVGKKTHKNGLSLSVVRPFKGKIERKMNNSQQRYNLIIQTNPGSDLDFFMLIRSLFGV